MTNFHPDSFEFYQSLPRKRMASGVLFVNERDHVLLVKPSYRDYWLLPGGIIENGEAPFETACREVIEEIGVTIEQGRMLCMDYCHTDGNKTESLQFIFMAVKWSGIPKIMENELTEFGFFPIDQAILLTSESQGKRLANAFKAYTAGQTFYLENGYNPFEA